MRWLVIAAIAVRLLAAGALAFGPWTDSASDLAGWDVERFQEIAEADGRPWVDNPVEYPPGSVVIIEAIAGATTVGTHRTLVLSSLFIDGAIAAIVTLTGGRRAGAWYLLLGLPLVPMGLLRFDLWSVVFAVAAVFALSQRKPRAFAVLATLGALIKAWPVLLLAPALALGRWRAAGLAIAAMGLSGLVWIGWAGWSLEPVSQVLSLRGASGWHVESVPGSVTALLGTSEPELQFNAYRIGALQQWLVRLGQAVTVAVVVALGVYGRRAAAHLPDRRAGTGGRELEGRAHDEVVIVATVLAGSVSALIVTAPLLSPQFLLWLTPWAALAAPGPDQDGSLTPPPLCWPVGAATVLTGTTLAAFGPPNLAAPLPAILLLARDGLLVFTIVVALRLLRHGASPIRGPRPSASQAERNTR